jgi:hypothetical protein
VNSAGAPTIDAPLAGKTQPVTKKPTTFPVSAGWRDDLTLVAIQSGVGAVKFSNYLNTEEADAPHNQGNRDIRILGVERPADPDESWRLPEHIRSS